MDKATKKDSKDQVGKEKKVESKPKPPPIVQKLAPVQPAKDSRTLGRRIRDKVGGFLGSVFRRKGRT
jgi:hypothetical protein